MIRELVFATNNPHKLKEIREIAGDHIRILSLGDIGFTGDIPETAPTIEGNASLKAWFIYDQFGIDCFADDTGLEVRALEGRPGVKSARYAGDECIAENNIRKLLDEMKDITDRRARFRTVISLIEKGTEIRFEGIVEGEILYENRGNGGFGYDPVFRPEGFDLSFAGMAPGDKNSISHRGRAVRHLIGHIRHSSSPR